MPYLRHPALTSPFLVCCRHATKIWNHYSKSETKLFLVNDEGRAGCHKSGHTTRFNWSEMFRNLDFYLLPSKPDPGPGSRFFLNWIPNNNCTRPLFMFHPVWWIPSWGLDLNCLLFTFSAHSPASTTLFAPIWGLPIDALGCQDFNIILKKALISCFRHVMVLFSWMRSSVAPLWFTLSHHSLHYKLKL